MDQAVFLFLFLSFFLISSGGGAHCFVTSGPANGDIMDHQWTASLANGDIMTAQI